LSYFFTLIANETPQVVDPTAFIRRAPDKAAYLSKIYPIKILMPQARRRNDKVIMTVKM
jgi:hypothetical protein